LLCSSFSPPQKTQHHASIIKNKVKDTPPRDFETRVPVIGGREGTYLIKDNAAFALDRNTVGNRDVRTEGLPGGEHGLHVGASGWRLSLKTRIKWPMRQRLEVQGHVYFFPTSSIHMC
jgi:hypothetical protein